jgi:hypothetical protein
MRKLQKFIGFILFLTIALLSFESKAATIGVNKVYAGSNPSGNTFTFATGSTTVNIVPLTGRNFSFTDHTTATTFTVTGSNYNGFLEYYDSNNNLVSIAGKIDKQDKANTTTDAIHFTPTTGSTTYLMIIPASESKYTRWGTGNISNTGTVGMSGNAPNLNTIAAATPQINLSLYTLSNFSSCINTASSYSTISVSGSNLSADIVATAPSNFEICATANGTYGSSVTFTKSGTSVASTSLYVRLKSNATAGSYSGSVSFTSTNASSQTVSVTGDVLVTTSITSSPSNVSTCAGTGTSFTVASAGANLTYQWQVSTNGGSSFTNLTNTGIYLGATSATLFLSSSVTSAYNNYQYKCVVTGTCSSATSNAATLTVNSLPAITVQPSNIGTCSGTGTSFSVTATGTGLTYQWQVSTDGGSNYSNVSGGIYSGETTSTLTLSSSVNASYNNYYYRCIVSGTCSPSVTSTGAKLTVNTAPSTPGTITGYNSICSNTNQYYSVAAVSGANSYTWTLPSGWTGSSTTNSINLVNNSSSGSLSVTATNACGTSSASTLAITVSNLPAPTPLFSIDNASQCFSGNLFTFTDASTPASGTTISSLSWNFGDATSSSISAPTHSFAAAGTYNVILTTTASNNCVASLSKAVTVNPAPTATISGTTSICSGSSTDLSISLTGTAPWTLVYSGSINPIVINSSPYTISVSPNATTTYTLSSLNDANCTAGAGDLSGSATITVNANKTASVSLTSSDADNSICSGASVTFTATPTNEGNAPTYQWLKNGNSFVNAGNTYTTTGLANNDQISVILTSNLSTCLVGSPTQSNTITTYVNPSAPATPATISGTIAQCAGLANQTYSISNVLTATSYNWAVPTGWSITSGQGTNTVSVTVGSSGQNGDITVSASNGCGTSSSQILAVTAVSTTNTITLSSASGTNSQTICKNSAITNITYSTTGSPTGATITGLPAGISGSFTSGTNIITISGTPTESGTFTYYVTLTGGSCNANISGTITVTATNTISLSSVIGTDSQTLCINTPITSISYTTTGATGASFSGLPTGVSGSYSSNTVSISGTPSVSGTFNYTITLTGGCGSVSTTGSIIVSAANTKTLSSAVGTDNQTKCVNTAITNITYSTTGATGISSLGLPAGVSANFSSNTITISGTPTGIGTFNYTITLTGGCSNVTATGTITVVAAASTPTITNSGNSAVCSGSNVTLTSSSAGTGGSYLWSTGATTSSISVSSAGTYTVTITNAGGCSATSAGTIITLTSLPTITATTGDSRCGAGTVNLSATPSAGTIDWFASATGGSSLSNGNAYNPSISSTTTFYVEATSGGCTSSRTAVTGTVTAIPTITSTTDASLCIPGTATISATASAGTVKWYDASSNGTLLSTGTSYTTPSISSTTSYYAEAVNGSCVSTSRTAVTVTFGSLSISISGSTTDFDLVSLTASGGTTYSWDGGNTPNSAANTFDETGTYTVNVSDGSGCSGTQSVSVTVKLRGLNKFGELIEVKANQLNRFGEEGSNNPILSSGQFKSYSKNLFFYLDASNRSSYSGSGTTWTDLSSGAQNTVLTNGPSYSSANGGTITFDGIDDYVSLPSAYPGSNDISIEAWVNVNSFNRFKVIANMDNWSTGYIHFQFSGNALQFALNGESDQYSTYPFLTSTWYHVVAVYDKSAKSISFYVNGSLTNTEQYSNPPRIANQAFKIGAWDDNSNLDRFFDGSINLVRIYGSVLSASQISNNFNNTKQKFGL